MPLPFDFDPFHGIDMNHDTVVDMQDLQMYELQNMGTFSVTDMDHDMIADKFDLDMNNDGFIDKYQADLNHNMVIDKFETNMGMTDFHVDMNHSGNVDHIDQALAKSVFGL